MTTLTREFRKIKPRLVRTERPFNKFMKSEAASGVILLSCIVIALVWINIDFDSYDTVFHTKIGITIGSFEIKETFVHWINDFLMASFFLLIGLEVKREILIGELSNPRKALLPIFAAFGGMIVPPLIYLIFANSGDVARGWAIPMATDIAFALGILFLLGKRIPTALRVFLATLAIVDDLGAVLIISLFYTDNLNFTFVYISVIVTLLLFLINIRGARDFKWYIMLGLILWFALYESGIHATLAGIIIALAIPATRVIDYQEFTQIGTDLMNQIHNVSQSDDLDGRRLKLYQNTVFTLEKACEDVEAPLQRIEHMIAPAISFGIIPIFALANAGIVLSFDSLTLFAEPMALGIILGLVVGKPLGIALFSYLSVKLGITSLPTQVSWKHILGVGCLGGVGFTMSMFIGALAFDTAELIDESKFGILVASAISGLLGTFILLYRNK